MSSKNDYCTFDPRRSETEVTSGDKRKPIRKKRKTTMTEETSQAEKRRILDNDRKVSECNGPCWGSTRSDGFGEKELEASLIGASPKRSSLPLAS